MNVGLSNKHCVCIVIREPVLQAAQSVPMPDGGEEPRSPARVVRWVAAARMETSYRALSATGRESSDQIRHHEIDGGQLEHLRDELARIAGDLQDGSQSARHLGSQSGHRD